MSVSFPAGLLQQLLLSLFSPRPGQARPGEAKSLKPTLACNACPCNALLACDWACASYCHPPPPLTREHRSSAVETGREERRLGGVEAPWRPRRAPREARFQMGRAYQCSCSARKRRGRGAAAQTRAPASARRARRQAGQQGVLEDARKRPCHCQCHAKCPAMRSKAGSWWVSSRRLPLRLTGRA